MERKEFEYQQVHNESAKSLIYYESGSGKKSIVMMHGYNFNSQTWVEVGLAKALDDAGYKTYLIDMPNFPKSVNKLWVTPDTFAEMLDLFISTVVKGKPSVLAASASGFYTARYLEKRNGKVDKIILVAPVNLGEVDLKHVDNKTLIVLGSKDPSNGYIKEGIKQLKGAKVITMDGWHVPYLEHPKEFCETVIGFLSND